MTAPSVVIGVAKFSISGQSRPSAEGRQRSALLPGSHLAHSPRCICSANTRVYFILYPLLHLQVKCRNSVGSAGTGRACKCQGTIRCQDLDSSCLSTVNSRTRFDSAGLALEV